MFRLLFLICFTTVIYGQIESNGKCPPTSDIDPFSWKDFTKTRWHEIFRTDKTFELKCAHVEYKEMGDKYTVYYRGEFDDLLNVYSDNATIIGKSTYTIFSRVQTVVVFKKDTYAVVHECGNVGETKKQTNTWILSAKSELTASEKAEIATELKAKGLDKEINLAQLNDPSRHEKCEY